MLLVSCSSPFMFRFFLVCHIHNSSQSKATHSLTFLLLLLFCLSHYLRLTTNQPTNKQTKKNPLPYYDDSHHTHFLLVVVLVRGGMIFSRTN